MIVSMIARIILVVFVSSFIALHAARVFPDLTNEDVFYKAQYFCELTDYQSTRLFKLQYLFKILSNDIESRLHMAVDEQRGTDASIERRIQLHHTIEDIRAEFAQLIDAYQHDVQSLLTKEQYMTLFELDSRDFFVISSHRHEKIAFR